MFRLAKEDVRLNIKQIKGFNATIYNLKPQTSQQVIKFALEEAMKALS